MAETAAEDAKRYNAGPAVLQACIEEVDAAARLKSFIERIERLEEEKAGITADITEIYGEAKGSGFNDKVMRLVVKLRKMTADARNEQEELVDLYMRALGMIV
jgi:uncharacterized protein (UPF0335 family)